MQNASSTTKQLYLFLAACSGSWRNTVYISCQGETDNLGYLLAADRAAGDPAGPAALRVDMSTD